MNGHNIYVCQLPWLQCTTVCMIVLSSCVPGWHFSWLHVGLHVELMLPLHVGLLPYY
jgi:hypothetical protein